MSPSLLLTNMSRTSILCSSVPGGASTSNSLTNPAMTSCIIMSARCRPTQMREPKPKGKEWDWRVVMSSLPNQRSGTNSSGERKTVGSRLRLQDWRVSC